MIDQLESEWKRFSWGAFGAFLLEFGRIYNNFYVSHLPIEALPRLWYVVSLGALLSAGLLAIATRAPNLFNAVYTGLTWPMLVSVFFSKAPEVTSALIVTR